MGHVSAEGIEPSDGAQRRHVCTLSMSHVHAKRFVKILDDLLKKHEREFGPITPHEKARPAKKAAKRAAKKPKRKAAKRKTS